MTAGPRDVRPVDAEERVWLAVRLAEDFGSPDIARNGNRVAPQQCEALRLGDAYATFLDDGHQIELVAIAARPTGQGLGSRLLGAVIGLAVQRGRAAVVVTTTNDNLRALEFYQRRGFRLAALRPGAVAEARKLKPEIPATGTNGLPIRDELDLVYPIESSRR